MQRNCRVILETFTDDLDSTICDDLLRFPQKYENRFLGMEWFFCTPLRQGGKMMELDVIFACASSHAQQAEITSPKMATGSGISALLRIRLNRAPKTAFTVSTKSFLRPS